MTTNLTERVEALFETMQELRRAIDELGKSISDLYFNSAQADDEDDIDDRCTGCNNCGQCYDDEESGKLLFENDPLFVLQKLRMLEDCSLCGDTIRECIRMLSTFTNQRNLKYIKEVQNGL